MTDHLIETVTFRVLDGVAPDAFLQAAQEATAFMNDCPGFLRRRLSCAADGTWTEHIEWASLDYAEAAAARIGQDARARAFVRAIDGPSVKLGHSALKVSVG